MLSWLIFGGKKPVLFITRKLGESIMIDDDIEVHILDLKGKSVKLGLSFPENHKVLRREVYERILEENKAAAQSSRLLFQPQDQKQEEPE